MLDELVGRHGCRASAAKAESPPRFITPNEFEGTDVERINRAIEAAAAAGCRVVIPRVNVRDGQRRDIWLLDSAILVRSDTTLELDNCRIKLSDRCRDNFIRSANCGLGITDIKPMQNIHIRGIGHVVLEGADHPRATGDSGKTIGAKTYGTDAGVAGESQTGDWRNIGILLAFVEGFSIENLAIQDSHCWAISLERCAHGRLRDLDFASSGFKMIDGARQTILNQDGIDLRLGCHDILIENITGYTGDDLMALTAIPQRRQPRRRRHDVHHGQFRGRPGPADRTTSGTSFCETSSATAAAAITSSGCLNTSGVRMHDILLDGLIDTSPEDVQCRAAVKIGDSGYGGGVAPLGDTYRIMVSNVTSKSTHTILIGGSLVRLDPRATSCGTGRPRRGRHGGVRAAISSGTSRSPTHASWETDMNEPVDPGQPPTGRAAGRGAGDRDRLPGGGVGAVGLGRPAERGAAQRVPARRVAGPGRLAGRLGRRAGGGEAPRRSAIPGRNVERPGRRAGRQSPASSESKFKPRPTGPRPGKSASRPTIPTIRSTGHGRAGGSSLPSPVEQEINHETDETRRLRSSSFWWSLRSSGF